MNSVKAYNSYLKELFETYACGELGMDMGVSFKLTTDQAWTYNSQNK